jgi:hypothetical protein
VANIQNLSGHPSGYIDTTASPKEKARLNDYKVISRFSIRKVLDI